MAATECDMVTQRATVLLLLLLCFTSLLNKSLGGPVTMNVRGYRHCANILSSQCSIKIQLQGLPLLCLRYCFQQYESLGYRFIIKI